MNLSLEKISVVFMLNDRACAICELDLDSLDNFLVGQSSFKFKLCTTDGLMVAAFEDELTVWALSNWLALSSVKIRSVSGELEALDAEAPLLFLRTGERAFRAWLPHLSSAAFVAQVVSALEIRYHLSACSPRNVMIGNSSLGSFVG